MSFSDAELEVQLKDAANGLLDPPSSTEELLSLLDRVEEVLTNVEQSPSKSLQDALLPVMKALISDELLRHSDMDVKVSVVSCIAQITRITAPDAPYGDDHMKEIFQLSVAALENLSQFSGRCYTKANSILDVIAKVRSSLIMLDLECDALVFEMFQHFLNHIRSDHPEAVFSSMEGIMSLVLHESEDIPLDIISLLLDSIKKENRNISPISRKLGENVITNCAATLEPYLMEAVKSLGINVDDYAEIVASICQNGKQDLKHKSANDVKDNLENENKLVKNTASNEPPQETKGLASDVICPEKTNQTADATSKSTSNGAPSTIKHDNPSQELQRGFLIRNSKRADSGGLAEPNSPLSLKADKTKSEPDSDKYESDPESVPRKSGNKRNSLKNREKGHSARADSKGIAKTKSSLSVKAEMSQNDPDSDSKKRDQKSKSLVKPEEGNSKRADPRGDSEPKSSLSVKAKSGNEPDSVPTKRGRKPNSLMNPEEGYDHSWLWSGRKTVGLARCRKSREKSTGSSPSGNSVLKKATSPSTLENMAVQAGLQSELDETIGDPSEDHSIPDGTKKGHPKRKGASLNREADIKSPSKLKGELLTAEVEEKTPKKEPEDIIPSDEKKEEHSTKLGVSAMTTAKTKDETAMSSAQMEAEDPRHPEEKLQQSTVKLEASNVNENSSVKGGRKKRKMVNDSPKKDVNEESGLKKTIFETETKSSNEDESYFRKSGKTLFKRKHVIGKEEACESLDFGELMVGRRIKVWWPMDKMFYEGVIDSYDPIRKRHKVCYNDGDVEILNMKNQRWETLGHDSLADKDQKSDLPGLDTSSPIPQKEKQKAKSDQKKQRKDDCSPESNPQKGKWKTKSNQKTQVKISSPEKEEKADYSPESIPWSGRGKTKPDHEKQAKRSGQAKARSSSKSNPRSGKVKMKLDKGTQDKKSNQEKQSKDDSSSEINPQKGKRKRESDEGEQAEKSDESNPVKADSSSKCNLKKGKEEQNSAKERQAEKSDESNPVKADSSSKCNLEKGKQKQNSAKEKQAKKSDESEQAKAESSSESNPKEGMQKRKPAGEKESDTVDESKQAKADTSSERDEMPAPESNLGTDAKSVEDTTKTGEILKDDGQMSAGDLEADTPKATSDCKKDSPKTLASSKGKSPKADIGYDSDECANKLVEMSKGGKEE